MMALVTEEHLKYSVTARSLKVWWFHSDGIKITDLCMEY